MQIAQFDGGLNSRAAPHLLQVNEGVEFTNVDIKSGALKQIGSHQLVVPTTAVNKSIYKYNNTWHSSAVYRSYVEFQGTLYYTDGVKPKYISTASSGDIGLSAPTDLTVTTTSGMHEISGSSAYANSFAVNSLGYSNKVSNTIVRLTSFDNTTVDITPATVGIDEAAFNSTFGTYILANNSYIVLLASNVTFLGSNSTIASIFYADGTFVKNIILGSSCTAVVDYDIGTNTFVCICDTVEKIVSIISGEVYTTSDTYTSCSINDNDIVCLFNYSSLAVKTYAATGILILSATAPNIFAYVANSKVRLNNDTIIISHTQGVIASTLDTFAGKFTIYTTPSVNSINLPANCTIAINSKNIFIAITSTNGAAADTQDVAVYSLAGRLVQNVVLSPTTTTAGTVKVFNDAISLTLNNTMYYSLLRDEDFNVQVTNYNSTLGIESMSSNVVDIVQSQNVLTVMSLQWTSNTISSNLARIYTNIYGTPTLAAEGVYTTASLNGATAIYSGPLIANGTALDSYANGTPPAALQYLTEYSAMLFGAVDDKLYYSEVAYPHYWGPFNFIDLEDAITGISAMQNGLLVFTQYKTYIVTGTSPESLTKYLLSATQGCVSHYTVASVANTSIWLSSDGVCASTGGDIQIVTQQKLGKLKYTTANVLCSAVYDSTYYLSLTDGILALDFSGGNMVVTKLLTFGVSSLHYTDDLLYASIAGSLYTMLSNTPVLGLSYTSPVLLDDVGAVNLYSNVTVEYEGSFILIARIDGVATTITLPIKATRSTYRVQQLENKYGYNIQFSIGGSGTVYIINYDTYNKNTIANSTKYYDIDNFKEIVKVNTQPIELEYDGSKYYSNNLDFRLTNVKLFKNVYIAYKGSITFKLYINSVEVLSVVKISSVLKVEELLIPNQYSRGYYIKIEYYGDGKLYDVEINPLERQDGGR